MAVSSPGQWPGSIVPPYMQIPIYNEVHYEYVSDLYMCVCVCVWTYGWVRACDNFIRLIFFLFQLVSYDYFYQQFMQQLKKL